MRHLFLLTIFALTLSCSSRVELAELPATHNRSLSSVLRLGNDTTVYYLTDYFPSLSGVDSIVCGDAAVSLVGENWDCFMITPFADAPVLSTLSIYYSGNQLNVVTQRLSGDFAELYTVGGDAKSVKLGFSQRPDRVVAMWQNQMLPQKSIKIKDNLLTISTPKNADGITRSFLRVYASFGDQLFSDVLIPLSWGSAVTDVSELNRHDKESQIMYSLMIDRFYDGDKSNNMPLNRRDVLKKVDYQGGDIAGITEKIKSGFFNDLGITTIWISPITQNPYDAWGLNKDPYTRFSGYHGYWPIYTKVVDRRFGTDEELHQMLSEAHDRGLNVILDYVANHLHIDSPLLREHPEWTTPLMLADGRRNLELWDEHRLTTWFDLHIPSLDLGRVEVYEPMSDSALYWLSSFDFDGFRHDATKHIPEVFWRTLTTKIKERFPDRSIYQIGETYGSAELIGSYVKSGMLDGQFDFNLYDRAIWNIGQPDGSMKPIGEELVNSLKAYGYHNLMGYITGNHDRPRFISLAGGALSPHGDTKTPGWKRDITVGDSISYHKLAILEAFIMTIPGVPCIYQGDEFGVPGANDPDNRRMMQFDGYNTKELELRSKVKSLTSLRRSNMSLLYGQLLNLYSDDDVLVYARTYMGETAVVAISNSPQSKTVSVELPSYIDISDLKSNFGSDFTIHQKSVTLTLSPVSFEVLIN